MDACRSGARIIARAPAKLNLFFEVLERRSDGFHEIETLMVLISLCDTLSFESDPSGQVQLDCAWGSCAGGDGASLSDLPPHEQNLATRAVKSLRDRSGISAGARIGLLKRIPLAAGLGGGSSDAAAALVAANRGWGLNWPVEKLAEIAAELGSDVPFFLGGSPAVCRGRGERIEPVALGKLHFVVVRPPAGLATAAVYARCKPASEPRSARPLVDALRSGDLRALDKLIYNGLEPAAAALTPWIGRLQSEFGRLDCVAAQMSGSGSSYFAICRHARQARRLAQQLRCRNIGSVFSVDS